MIRQQDLGDGVAALLYACDGALNTLDASLNRELGERIDALLADDGVKGIVIGSDKPDFIAGGDLKELQAAPDPASVVAIVAPFLAALRKIEKGGKPVVAALPGTALGGGLELALACHQRIAADNASARFGFPEATLGLMPGAGGTQRLPRLIGIAAAAPMLLDGTRLSLADAVTRKLIDQVVAPADLLETAKQWALANPGATQPWDRKGFAAPGFAVQSAAGRQFFAGAWARASRGAGASNLAARAILECLQQGMERSLEAGIVIETRQFARLAAGNDAKNKIRTLFNGVNRARSMTMRPSGPPPSTVGHLAVIGGGVMGRGIAHVAALAGLQVTLLDLSDEAARKSRDEIARNATREHEKGRLRMTPQALLSRIEPTADYARIAQADFVLEAVFERADVKQAVLERAAAVVGRDVPIASNTSTMPITGLAGYATMPERVIGLHFFSPVDRMPLVEVIRARQTSDATLARALDLMKQLGKTPVVVNDGLGFFTSRIVTTYSSETLNLIGEGVPPQLIDNAAVNAGFAIGGAALAELTTMPLLADILKSMRGDGQRIANAGNRAEPTLAALLALGRIGKAAGKGLYDYGPEGRAVWPGLALAFPPAGDPLDEETVRQRLFAVQSLEAVRALDDGILGQALDGDVAAVLGWGYPVHLGGVFGYIDRVGVPAFIAQCESLAARFGARFDPPRRLRDMAAAGQTFYPDEATR
ncbi:Fatty acid oxidation complex subunit alpha (plasmid) [Variovorax sp. SRS16]|uniref:3-hydroxyacyl-CoA dehydrogenase NAD-binding domain-containing protein n=1 Tax=Variovorax sp. SRS16 TaxID=282217 RepID=UPI001317B53C|nr:3-hydroxyacyl-CoA dehydrogenase NAD-binding domain-containing protein [Variovorax sp. SRS16]VTU46735.1 Fatty acid oxidation complex subunit alpha [Variovorax sp. SRS16]